MQTEEISHITEPQAGIGCSTYLDSSAEKKALLVTPGSASRNKNLEKTAAIETGLFDSDLWLGARFSKGQAIADLLFLCVKRTGEPMNFPVSFKEETLCNRWKWSKTAVLALMMEIQERGVLNVSRVQKGKTMVFMIIARWNGRKPVWKAPEEAFAGKPELETQVDVKTASAAVRVLTSKECIPTLDEWLREAQDEGFPQEAATQAFYSCDAKGWMVGKTPIQNWRSYLRVCHSYWRDRNPGYVPSDLQAEDWPPRGDWEGAVDQLHYVPDYEKRIWKKDPSCIPLPARAEIRRNLTTIVR